MIIVTFIAVAAFGAAAYFVVQNGRLSSIIEDKEMVAQALRAQVESDKLKIAALKLEIEMSQNRSANKPVEVQKANTPRRRPAKKAPKQD
jgi:hypothetical protein